VSTVAWPSVNVVRYYVSEVKMFVHAQVKYEGMLHGERTDSSMNF
jgi:hypothetical protein